MSNYTVVAAHGLIEKDGKFLVLHRSRTDGYMAGFWDIPGGTIEFGEDIKEALIREIKEETGLEVKIGKILGAYGYQSGEDRHQFQLTYECEFVSGEIELEVESHDEFRWVTIIQMKSLKKIAFLKDLYKSLNSI
jgi:8-oxo-dGTP diphosphatase